MQGLIAKQVSGCDILLDVKHKKMKPLSCPSFHCGARLQLLQQGFWFNGELFFFREDRKGLAQAFHLPFSKSFKLALARDTCIAVKPIKDASLTDFARCF